MSALLTVEEPDGFPLKTVIKIMTHPHSGMVGQFGRIYGKPINPPKVRQYKSEDVDGRVIINPSERNKATVCDGYYGQKVESMCGEGIAFIALTWMRPATPEELEQL